MIADFAPGAQFSNTTWRGTVNKFANGLYLICPIMLKHDVIDKTKSIQHTISTLSSSEDRATATGNMYRKFHEVFFMQPTRMKYSKHYNK